NPFANGGIVTRPTPALIGEAGKEVVIPLTRPGRAADLAQQSGLIDLLAERGVLPGSQHTPGVPVVGEFHVHSQNADPEQVARRAARIIERGMSGRGLEGGAGSPAAPDGWPPPAPRSSTRPASTPTWGPHRAQAAARRSAYRATSW